MRNILISALLLTTTLLHADFIRIEAGGGSWMEDTSGEVHHKKDPFPVDLKDELGVDGSNDLYLWASFKHFIPIIPNARVEYTSSELSGTSDTAFAWNSQSFTQGSSYNMTMDQLDAMLYYNLLDNLFWMTLDVGLNAKFISTDYKFGSGTSAESLSEEIIVPMAYVRGRVELPASGFGAEARIKYFSYGDSSVSDLFVKLDYTFDTLIIQPGIEIGYRYESITTSRDEFDSMDSDLDLLINGLYVGVMLRY